MAILLLVTGPIFDLTQVTRVGQQRRQEDIQWFGVPLGDAL